MFKKLLIIWILFYILVGNITVVVSIGDTYTEQPLTIITREQWWANEEFSYIESSYWQDIIERRKNTPQPYISEAKKKKAAQDYIKKINYINENFSPQNTVTERIKFDGKNKLAWQIKKSDYVNAIVVHHTSTDYTSSFEGVRQIYKYHSLGREWWDIGYNYIIGYDGEIFEGKKWWDYTVGAHSKWNNISTVGIAIMGNYENKKINSLQYTSLEKLVQSLVVKYGINLSNDYYYNMECSGAACNIFPLETHLHKTLSWHRDTGHTSCPWGELYKQIEQIRVDNLDLTADLTPVKRGGSWTVVQKEPKVIGKNQKIVKALKKLSKKKIEKLIKIIDKRLEIEDNDDVIERLKVVRIIARRLLG